MTRSSNSLVAVLLVVFSVACGGTEEAEDHEHAEGTADHAHTPDGGHLPAAAVSPRQGSVVTVHTDSIELFIEHPALVVGSLERFAVHVTDATDFKPLTAGTVTFRFVPRDGGSPVVITQDAPQQAGIYAPAPDFARAGTYDLAVLVGSPQATDSVLVPGLVVHARAADAPPAQALDTTGIAYTKEQQWQTPGFRIARVDAAGAGVTIPTSAILREDDNRVAYVQKSGEHFEKRVLTVGGATGNATIVTAGIQPGEYVVSGGAAQLRRETLSPADRAHGHSH